jgi:hypothetical protein
MVLRAMTLLLVATVATATLATDFDQAAAYSLLNSRTAANRASFEIYRDADSGFNHGSLTSITGATARVHINSSCIDDPSTASGCSSDPNRLDRTRGTILSITFDPLASGETAAVHIVEPEGGSPRASGKGYDVTGATSITFEVRTPSPTGIDVQFGAGDHLSDFTHIAPSEIFTAMTLPITGLPEAALRDLRVLFTVSTDQSHAAQGGTLLIDNIRFAPAPGARRGVLGFPLASESFGILPALKASSGRVPIPVDQSTRNVSTVGDSALALIALLDRGSDEDLANAAILADSFHYALHHDSAAGSLKAPDAIVRNGYRAGDLAPLNDDSSGAKADVPRLAGFSASPELCGPSSFCVVLDGTTGGNAALAILALTAAAQRLGNEGYREDAELLGDWIASEFGDSTTAPNAGGYFLGYADREDRRVMSRTKSVADNALIFAALSRLGATERNPRGGVSKWNRAASTAGDFVMRMFDTNSGRFYAGTVPTGTSASFGVTPNGQQLGTDVINTAALIEANTLTVLALGPSSLYRNAIDWSRPLRWLSENSVTLTAGGETFQGFGFAREAALGPAGIAWDATAQAVSAMRVAQCLFGAPFSSEIAFYRGELARAQTGAPFTDGLGVTATTLENGDGIPAADQCLSTPGRCLPQRVNLGSTAWALFAARDRNPLGMYGTAPVCVSRRRSVN